MIWEIICWVMSSESRIALFFCLLSSRISSSMSRRTVSMSLPFICERKRVYSSSSACGSISCAASQPSSCVSFGADGSAEGLGERDQRAGLGSASESDEADENSAPGRAGGRIGAASRKRTGEGKPKAGVTVGDSGTTSLAIERFIEGGVGEAAR